MAAKSRFTERARNARLLMDQFYREI
jgi:hypothetical protein